MWQVIYQCFNHLAMKKFFFWVIQGFLQMAFYYIILHSVPFKIQMLAHYYITDL